MSDIVSGQPVRSPNDPQFQLVSKIADGAGGGNNATVDSDKNLHVLAAGHNPAGASVPMRVSELGDPSSDGLYSSTNNTIPATIGGTRSTRSASPGPSTQTLRLTGVIGTDAATVSADVSLHDASGNPYTTTNPLPVVVSASAGTLQVIATDSPSVAVGSPVNVDFAVPSGKTMFTQKVMCSASGLAKFTLQTSPDGTTFTTQAVRFNSTANPNCDIEFPSNVPCTDTGTGAKVRIIVANLDPEGAQDIYTTLCGYSQ